MNVLKSSIIYSFFTSISRLLGYVRDILIATFLGTGVSADIFFISFRFPNTFRRIFSEGALNSAFVPIYSKLLANNLKNEAKIFAGNTFILFFFFALFTVIIIEIFMPNFVAIFAPGFLDNEEKFSELVKVSRIIFPFLILIFISSLYSSILNSHNYFALSAALPAILNLCIILSLILAYYFSKNYLYFLAWSVISGGFLQTIFLIVTILKNNIEIQYFTKIIFKNLKSFGKLFSVSFFSSGLLQINILIGTVIASFETGAISYLYYADRIYQLPLALIGITLGIVMLPAISSKIEKNQKAEINNTIENTIIYALLISVPASVGIYVIPELIIGALFERGEFNYTSTSNTAKALKFYGIGLVAFILMKIYTPIFFAYENPKPALYVTLINLMMNTLLSIILFIQFGFVGIAIATSISAWVSVIIMQYFLNKNHYFKLTSDFYPSLIIIILVSSLIYFYLTFINVSMNDVFEVIKLNKIIFLLFSVVSSILLYFFIISFYKPFSYKELKKVINK